MLSTLMIYFIYNASANSTIYTLSLHDALPIYIEINRQRVNQEQDLIVHYLDTAGMDMQRTATGLWYRITEEGEGDYIVAGKVVSLNRSEERRVGKECRSRWWREH